jgi:hypothetical protein
MNSRTPEGKHTTRFIVLKKGGTDEKFVRSNVIREPFPTREAAQEAINSRGVPGVAYKVRMK